MASTGRSVAIYNGLVYDHLSTYLASSPAFMTDVLFLSTLLVLENGTSGITDSVFTAVRHTTNQDQSMASTRGHRPFRRYLQWTRL